MPKTRNHVYYRLEEAAGEVEILLVWNAGGWRNARPLMRGACRISLTYDTPIAVR
jgi:hypothetical protein